MADALIAAREKLLDRLVCEANPSALNETNGNQPAGVPDVNLRSLGSALRTLRAAAISEDGTAVDYDHLRSGDAFRAYRLVAAGLARFDPATRSSRAEQLAFWINLYNGLTIDGVVQLGIRRRVTERLGGLGFFRCAAYVIGGQRLSLDDIEHGILRMNRGHPFIPGPQFAASDPRIAWMIVPFDVRIHFALNCASRSCPPVAFYEPDRIDEQLDLATRNFVDADIEVEQDSHEISLSRIFKWYSEDFGGREGIIDFLMRYLPDGELRVWLQQYRSAARLVYQSYDWELNSVRIASRTQPGTNESHDTVAPMGDI